MSNQNRPNPDIHSRMYNQSQNDPSYVSPTIQRTQSEMNNYENDIQRVLKCRTFFTNLISLCNNEQYKGKQTMIIDYIQRLINNEIDVLSFMNMLKSNFKTEASFIDIEILIKDSINSIRRSLLSGNVEISGIRPPPHLFGYRPSRPVQLPQRLEEPRDEVESMDRRDWSQVRPDMEDCVEITENCNRGIPHNYQEELFLVADVLLKRFTAIAGQFNIQEIPLETMNLLSRATQCFMRQIVEQAIVVSELRADKHINDPRYEMVDDVKAQLRCIDDYNELEHRRREESTMESLNKASKSRARTSDPEFLEMKKKVKKWQQEHEDLLRNKESNETALAALGQRKRLSSMRMGDQFGNQSKVKKISMRDILLVLKKEEYPISNNTKFNILFSS